MIDRAKIKMAVAKEPVLAAAVELAQQALDGVARTADIGAHLGCFWEAERVVTHCFECLSAGYQGWVWVVTLTRVPRSKQPTVCEVSLVPADGALLAPRWIPWGERLQPSDLRPGDVFPKVEDDPRLEPGFAAVDASGFEDADKLEFFELGLGRHRVLSVQGRNDAFSRWYNGAQGPTSGMARFSAQPCSSCGYLMQMAGSARAMFGVCANPLAPDDGHVVSLDHGCGAHSETDEHVTAKRWEEPEMVIDETQLEEF